MSAQAVAGVVREYGEQVSAQLRDTWVLSKTSWTPERLDGSTERSRRRLAKVLFGSLAKTSTS